MHLNRRNLGFCLVSFHCWCPGREIYVGSRLCSRVFVSYLWCDVFSFVNSDRPATETEMSHRRNFRHWLHRKLSIWQHPVQPVATISIFPFRNSSRYLWTLDMYEFNTSRRTKRRTFCRGFHMNELERKIFILIQIPLKFIIVGPMDETSGNLRQTITCTTADLVPVQRRIYTT